MCTFDSTPRSGCSNQAQAATADTRSPEVILAEIFQKDLGVTINPQAFRMLIRFRFDRIATLAHKIHGA